ncbi:MAG: hypothetical protein DHS80DRAFT_28692 [Piptocephalis tieghemiana]|nr:MAG: hypothetical protein DHS80DRAFT_28692 [Piptocephalis tieghemiana]
MSNLYTLRATSSTSSLVSINPAKLGEDKEGALMAKAQKYKDQVLALQEENERYQRNFVSLQAETQSAHATLTRQELAMATKEQEYIEALAEIKALTKVRKELEKQRKQETNDMEQERSQWAERESSLTQEISTLKAQVVRWRGAAEEAGSDGKPSTSLPRRHSMAQPPSMITPEQAATYIREAKIAQRTIKEQDKMILELRNGLEKEQEALESMVDQYRTQELRVAYLESQVAQTSEVNRSLMEDCESYQLLLQERTVNGQFAENMRQRQDQFGEEEKDKSAPETNGDTLQPPIDPSKDSSLQVQGKVGKAGGGGGDLAAELYRAFSSPTSPSSPVFRDLAQSGNREKELEEEVKKLQGEIKGLRDETKALTLYINKILSRVMENGSLEAVLAHDTDYSKMPKTPSSTTSTTFASLSSPTTANSNVPKIGPAPARRRSSLQSFSPTSPHLKPPPSPLSSPSAVGLFPRATGTGTTKDLNRGSEASRKNWKRHHSISVSSNPFSSPSTAEIEEPSSPSSPAPPAASATGGGAGGILRKAFRRMSSAAWRYPASPIVPDPSSTEKADDTDESKVPSAVSIDTATSSTNTLVDGEESPGSEERKRTGKGVEEEEEAKDTLPDHTSLIGAGPRDRKSYRLQHKSQSAINLSTVPESSMAE